MNRRLALPLVGTLLLAVGIAFAWWGFRALASERARSEAEARERARALLDEAVQHALVEAAEPSTEPDESWRIDRGHREGPPLPGSREALLAQEAVHLDSVQDDPEAAFALLLRLANDEDGGPWRHIAALRAGTIRIRLGRPAGVRRLLEFAAEGKIHEEGGLPVSLLARYHLAVVDVLGARTEGIDAFLDAAGDGRRLSASDWTGPDDLILALHRRVEDSPLLRDIATRRLERAAGRARQGRVLLVLVSTDGVQVLPYGVVRRTGSVLDLRGHARLLAGLPGDGVEKIDVVPASMDALPGALVRLLPAPLDGLALHVLPRSPPVDRAAHVALAVALCVYVLACGLGLSALRRSQRVAAMQSDFVAAVSHELKTPIASVRAMAEFLADGPADDTAKVRDYARRIEGEMGRLGATVRNVLDVARIERQGSLPVVRRPDDPAAIVRLTCDAFEPILLARGFRFRVDVRDAGGSVPLDRAAYQSVLMNLIDNAAKFSTDERSIEVDAGPLGDAYRVEVKDRGRGIPAYGGARLFQRFVRDDAVKRDAVPGVGLGLFVVREIVAAHGGTVTARRRDGGGSVFTVEIPLAAPKEPTS